MENLSAKDFRIGNLITVIRNIGSKDDFIVKATSGDIVRIEEKSFETWIYEPIALTEEWLIDLGFRKDDNGNYWIDLQSHYLELMQSNGYWYPTYVQVPEMSHENEQKVSINRIEFIHQLQNLFFSLTGEELTPK